MGINTFCTQALNCIRLLWILICCALLVVEVRGWTITRHNRCSLICRESLNIDCNRDHIDINRSKIMSEKTSPQNEQAYFYNITSSKCEILVKGCFNKEHPNIAFKHLWSCHDRCSLCPTLFKKFPVNDLCLIKFEQPATNASNFGSEYFYYDPEEGSCQYTRSKPPSENSFTSEKDCAKRCPNLPKEWEDGFINM